jgi:hypothetical protein
MNSGCNDCTPYAWNRVLVPGRGECCRFCGRVIDGHELVLVTNAPPPPRRHENPWGRGIRKDERGLPYLDKNGQPLRLGEPFNPDSYGNRPVVINGQKGN